MQIGNPFAAFIAFINPFNRPAHFDQRIEQAGTQRVHANAGDDDIALRGDQCRNNAKGSR